MDMEPAAVLESHITTCLLLGVIIALSFLICIMGVTIPVPLGYCGCKYRLWSQAARV